MGKARVKTDKSIDKLLKRCSKGDRKSQECLYKDYYNYALSVAFRFSNSYVMAEEIVNDAFYKVFTKTHLYNPEYDFKAWLRRIVVNTSVDYVRREIKNLNILFVDEVMEFEEKASDEVQPKAEEIIKALQQMSPTYRTVFNLFVMEGYTHEAIASELNISASTSRSNLARAKAQLKELLTKKG